MEVEQDELLATRVDELTDQLKQDLTKELDNPFDPFFREPPEDGVWISYVAGVKSILQKQIQELARGIAAINRKID